MSGILTLALKDLRLLLRDRAGLFWVLAWPLAMGLIFGSIMGGMGERPRGGMRIAVVDEDSTAASRAMIARLDSSAALRVEPADLARARDLVRRGERVGYVRLKRGYGRSTGFGSEADSSRIEVGMDPSRTAEKGYLEGLLMQAWFAGLQQRFAEPETMRTMVRSSLDSLDSATDMPPAARARVRRFLGSLDEYLGSADTSTARRGGMGFSEPQIESTPVVREDAGRPRSGFEISFPTAILWALIGCAAGFAMSLVYERMYGTFLRLRTTPLSRRDVLVGKGLACFVASVVVAVLLLAIGGGFLGVRVSQPGLLALGLVCAAFCFTGLMMFISSLSDSPRGVSGAGWAMLLGMAMTGGGMIPLIAMPPWMRTVSHVSPVKWGILALEGAIWRGFSPAEMLLPCAVLVGVGVLGFAGGWALFSRSEI